MVLLSTRIICEEEKRYKKDVRSDKGERREGRRVERKKRKEGGEGTLA